MLQPEFRNFKTESQFVHNALSVANAVVTNLFGQSKTASAMESANNISFSKQLFKLNVSENSSKN